MTQVRLYESDRAEYPGYDRAYDVTDGLHTVGYIGKKSNGWVAVVDYREISSVRGTKRAAIDVMEVFYNALRSAMDERSRA